MNLCSKNWNIVALFISGDTVLFWGCSEWFPNQADDMDKLKLTAVDHEPKGIKLPEPIHKILNMTQRNKFVRKEDHLLVEPFDTWWLFQLESGASVCRKKLFCSGHEGKVPENPQRIGFICIGVATVILIGLVMWNLFKTHGNVVTYIENGEMGKY